MTLAGVGLWFTLARRSKLGRAVRPASWGFSLLMAYAVGRWILIVTQMVMQIRSGGPLIDLQTMLITFNLLHVAAYAVFLAGLVLLGRAIFADREPRSPSAEAAAPTL